MTDADRDPDPGDSSHYRFPPARAYALNRCLYRLKSEAAFRVRYVTEARAALADAGLSEAEQTALLEADRDALVGLGAHPYLVFMAQLRLRMDREGAAFEYF